MTVISFIAIFSMIIGTINVNKALDNQDYISSVLRSYVTKMELAGCLYQDDIEQLVEDLQNYGMKEIYLYGNFSNNVSQAAVVQNYGPASYGEDVQLRVKGTMVVKAIEEASSNFLGLGVSLRELEVDMQQKGIAVR